MSDSIKDKISKKLGDGERLSSGDFAEFQPAAKKEAELASTAPLAEGAKNDPIINTATDDESPGNATRLNLHRSATDLGISVAYKDIDITEDDRNEFIDCLIDNRRFTRDFSIFGGKVTGTIRSRTSDESRALLYEAQRRVSMGEVLSDADYAAVFRRATMRFQIQQLNAVEYPEAKGPLLAQATFKSFMLNDKAAEPPAWYTEAETAWSGMQTGLEAAIFTEIVKFEYKYWTMVENSTNQDFWNPED